MNKFNEQYYIAFKNFNDATLYLAVTDSSKRRLVGEPKLELGDEPIFFENGYKDRDISAGVVRPIKNAHMNINRIVVSDELAQDLKQYEFDGFQLFPSVIVDDSGKYHEDFWLFNIYERLNCIDFDKSVVDDYDPDDERHDIEKYCLDEGVLDKIPEEKRLVFRPTGTTVGYTFVHQKIVDVFQAKGVDTLRFIKISDWEDGEEF